MNQAQQAQYRVLQRDIASMVREAKTLRATESECLQLAHDIIVVVRERVLREIETYARQNIR